MSALTSMLLFLRDLTYAVFAFVLWLSGRKSNSSALGLRSKSGSLKQHVLILGGSFAGLAVSRRLSDDHRLRITIVSASDFAEYVPGVLRAFVDPSHAATLQSPLIECVPAGTEVVTGTVESVDDGGCTVTVRAPDGSTQCLSYDYLVVATGSNYPGPIKTDIQKESGAGARIADGAEDGHRSQHLHPSSSITPGMRYRRQVIQQMHEDLSASKHILIVGGGPVGVEMAGELVHRWPVVASASSSRSGDGADPQSGQLTNAKRLTIVTASDRLLDGMEPSLGDAALKWMRARGVEVILSDRLVNFVPGGASASSTIAASGNRAAPASGAQMVYPGRQQPTSNGIYTKNGLRLECDYIISCIGARPSSDFARLRAAASTSGLGAAGVNGSNTSDRIIGAAASTLLSEALLANGKIAVDDTMRVMRIPVSGMTSTAAPATGTLALPSSNINTNSRVFALGDVASPPYREPDVAHTAEKQAVCVAANIQALVAAADEPAGASAIPPTGGGSHGSKQERTLYRYPADIPGHNAAATIFCVSLGPYHGLLAFNTLTLTDRFIGMRISAAMKYMIEATKVSEMRNRWIGVSFWRFADTMAEMTSKWVLKPRQKAASLNQVQQQRLVMGASGQGAMVASAEPRSGSDVTVTASPPAVSNAHRYQKMNE